MIFRGFSTDFLQDWRSLKKEGTQAVIFLFHGDDFLYWDPLTQGTLFYSHFSLCYKIVSFSPYSEWVNRQYVETLQKQTATGKQFGAILAAHSIATTLKYWYHGSPPGEIVSLGVLSEGKFASSFFFFFFILDYFQTSPYTSCSCFCVPASALPGL